MQHDWNSSQKFTFKALWQLVKRWFTIKDLFLVHKSVNSNASEFCSHSCLGSWKIALAVILSRHDGRQSVSCTCLLQSHAFPLNRSDTFPSWEQYVRQEVLRSRQTGSKRNPPSQPPVPVRCTYCDVIRRVPRSFRLQFYFLHTQVQIIEQHGTPHGSESHRIRTAASSWQGQHPQSRWHRRKARIHKRVSPGNMKPSGYRVERTIVQENFDSFLIYFILALFIVTIAHSSWQIYISLLVLSRRMEAFEDNLCTTVDAILELLGETPKVVRERYQTPAPDAQRPHRIDFSHARTRVSTPGAKLAKSQSEL